MVLDRMRAVVGALLLGAALALPVRPSAEAADAAAILKAAREAIGGDAKVRGLKSLRLTGTTFSTQSVFGGYTQDSEEGLDIRFALPDRFLETTLMKIGSAALESRKGFAGTRTISTSNGESVAPPGEETYVRKKAAELLLVLLARTEPWGGLALEADGANAIKVRGLDGYAARLEFDPGTHLLTRLTYRQRRQVRPRNTILRKDQTAKPAAAGSSGGVGAGARPSSETAEIDIAITFHDHRKIDGILLPHRITTTAVAAGLLLWELRFEKIAVNPPVTDADFGK